jgi:hypothetical protein
MPMHDWTRVPDGIFHAFHHRWISAVSDELNASLLPKEYYALPEQVAAGFGPDVLTLQTQPRHDNDAEGASSGATATTVLTQTRPRTSFVAETEGEFYRRKKSWIAVRHISGDEIVAIIEIVSPGNKASRRAFDAFLDKAFDLIEERIHLLIVDPFPPGPRDPNGIHCAIWGEVEGDSFQPPPDKPLTLVAYECDAITRAYIEPIAVCDPLPNMPLFLQPNGCVMVPLEACYETAFKFMPRRWRVVLETDSTV